MEQEIANGLVPLADEALSLGAQALAYAEGFLRPGWRLWQLAIVAAIAAAAWLLRGWTAARMTDWMRARQGLRRWQLRALVILRNRLGLVFFAALAWGVYGAMQGLTWPSRSYLVGLAATIGTAWMLVSFVARLIRNGALRRVVTWGLSAYVTLFYLGIWDETRTLLDRLALEFGELRLSVLGVLTALVVIGVLFWAARFVSKAAGERISRSEEISPSLRVLLVKLLQIALYAGAFFLGLRAVGVDLTGFAVLSGAIGVGLGFGLQKVVSNLVSGFIILLDKSIKPGDVISLGETFGWVTTLTARYVSITTRDGKEYLIPNEDLITGQVVNWSHSNSYVRLDIHFGTSYGDDPHLVRRLAVEAAASVPRVLETTKPVCHITGFGDSSVDYILRFWITDPTGGLTNIRGNVYLALWDAFRAHGVSIPFPQREVRMLGAPDGGAANGPDPASPEPPPDARPLKAGGPAPI
jgi:small-conductance mechanosensitive channel